jgi:MFS family permease
LDTTNAHSFRRDARIIVLVGIAHSLWHFFQLALPPLFPLLRAEFDVSFTLLGALVGTFYGASGATQFAAGFAVDRVGARPVLLSGMTLLVAGTLGASLAPGPAWLFPAAAVMGVGNGVFHPADFAILNANVNPKRLGYAYSMHGVGGNPATRWRRSSASAWAPLSVGARRLSMWASSASLVLGTLASQRVHLAHATRMTRRPTRSRAASRCSCNLRSCCAFVISCCRRWQRSVCKHSCRRASMPGSQCRWCWRRRR